jgi:purine-nucleoside phosphorylase
MEPRSRAAEFIRSWCGDSFEVGGILGSGLSKAAGFMEKTRHIPYREIPGLPIPRVPGHFGELILGSREGRACLFFAGRVHFYEGYTPEEINLPVRICKELGVSLLLLTTAAGAIRSDLMPGDFLFVEDHVNLLGFDPLSWIPVEARKPAFFAQSDVYDREAVAQAAAVASELKLRASTGVLAALPGPCYETPAEVRALGRLQVDAVSMSAVPEAVFARYLGMKVLTVCVIANRAGARENGGLTHERVVQTVESRMPDFQRFLSRVVKRVI